MNRTCLMIIFTILTMSFIADGLLYPSFCDISCNCWRNNQQARDSVCPDDPGKYSYPLPFNQGFCYCCPLIPSSIKIFNLKK